MKVLNMTEGRPVRLLLSVALPLMVGNIFQQLYTVVDARIVGSVEGVSALAALGASDWFNWLCLGLIQGFAQGFTIPMAQAFGAKRYDQLRRCTGNAVLLAAFMAAVITAVSLLSITTVLRLLDTPPEIMPLSVRYLTILYAAYPVVMAYNLMAGILRSLGDGRSPLYAMVIAAVVNIALDLIFVAGFRWGVAGAAVATVIAQCCSCVFCFFRIRAIAFMRLDREDFRPDRGLCGHLMRLGIPIALQNGIIGVGGMAVQKVVNTLGVAFIAGYTATNKLYGVLETAAISYGYAVTTYTGQNVGAGRIDRVRRGVRAAFWLGNATAAAIALAMFLFGRGIVSSFISGKAGQVGEAVEVACEYLYLMSGCLPVLYILYVYRSALQGMGNTVIPMVSGVVELFMRVGSAWLLLTVLGHWGIYLAEVLAWLGADLILVPSYYLAIKRVSGK